MTPAAARSPAIVATPAPGGNSTNTSASVNPRYGVVSRVCSHHERAGGSDRHDCGDEHEAPHAVALPLR